MPDPTQRRLASPAYPEDAGAAPAELTAALAAWQADPERFAEALVALAASRLLVPVVAVLDEVEHGPDGPARDKSSDMAAVLVRGADGRTALLAFTGLEAMRAWDPRARPVPVAARLAARSALDDGAAALALDLAGPVPFVVEREDLRGLAEGWTPTRLAGRVAWIGPGPE